MNIKQRLSAPAILLALLSGHALAQSSVQLYGNLDAGVTYASKVGGKSSLGAADGVQRSNVFGMQGTEDLGDGQSVVFKLNTGFSLDTGALTTSNLIFKEAWVGLKDQNYGRITIGRQYDFIKEITNNYLACLECGIYSVPNADIDRTNGDFVTNTVQYRSRDYAGMAWGAMYGFGSTDATSTNAGRMYSAFAQYMNGPIGAIFVTTNMNKAPLAAGNIGVSRLFGINVTSTTSLTTDRRILAGGLTYKWGSFTAMGFYTNTRLDYQQQSATDQEFSLGGTYWLANNVLLAVMEGVNVLGDDRWYTTNAGLTYMLSKTTRTYVDFAWQRASGAGTYAALRTVGPAGSPNQVLVRIGMMKYF